jgi:acyl-CoA thioester hydrolase
VPEFRHRLRVRYVECDAQGVVFNSHYLAYFDVGITELWREALGSYQVMIDDGVDVVVAEARVRYLDGLRFDDEFDLVMQISRLGETSMTTDFKVERAGGDLCAEGELRHVFVRAGSVEKIAIPDDIRAGLEPYG